jgi:hypothetical protein
VTNASRADPVHLHRAEVLVGIEDADLIVRRFQMENAVSQVNARYHVTVAEDVVVQYIDEEFV